jgi:hypothetical protein
MNPDIFAAILDLLRADTTLVSLLGGPYVYRSHGVTPARIPSVTLLENNESSKLRPGYNTFRDRDNAPTLQVDVWIDTNQETPPCTGEDADYISEQIDKALFAPGAISGTRGWNRASGSTQHDEDIGGVHKALRYSFAYTKTDN